MLLLKALSIATRFQYGCLYKHNIEIMFQLISEQKRVAVVPVPRPRAFRMFYWRFYDYIQLCMCRSFITEENIVT